MLQLVGLLGWPKGGCVASSPPAVLQCGCLFSKMCISKVKVLRWSSVQLYITLCRCKSVVLACVLPRPLAAVGLLLGITSPCHAEIVCNPVTMATSGCSTLARFLLLNGWTRLVSPPAALGTSHHGAGSVLAVTVGLIAGMSSPSVGSCSMQLPQHSSH